MVPDPCYASYLQFIQCSGAKAYPMPLTAENDYKPDVEAIYEQIIKDGYKPENIKALFINFPNNPMGISTTREYVQSVINFCKNTISYLHPMQHIVIYTLTRKKNRSAFLNSKVQKI